MVDLSRFCSKAKICNGFPHGKGGYHVSHIEVKAVFVLTEK